MHKVKAIIMKQVLTEQINHIAEMDQNTFKCQITVLKCL